MRELLRTQRITIAVAAFVLVIIVGLITLRSPDFVYQVDPDQVILAIEDEIEYEIVPEDAVQLYEDASFAFVDVRSPYEFEKGHLPNAINIPLPDLLDKENTNFFTDMASQQMSVIIYGEGQLDANKAWMLLYQIGFTNCKQLLGGYTYLKTHNPSFYRLPKNPEYFVEDAERDFASIMESMAASGGSVVKKSGPKKITPVRKKKKSVAEGGC